MPKKATTKAETTAAPETVEVECIQNYKDLCLDRIVKVGERQEVTPERAALLLEENLVKRV